MNNKFLALAALSNVKCDLGMLEEGTCVPDADSIDDSLRSIEYAENYIHGVPDTLLPYSHVVDENVTHCPLCGGRTQFMDRGNQQLHWCMNDTCGAIFMAEEDEPDDEGEDDNS